MTLKEATEYVNDELDILGIDPVPNATLKLRLNRFQRDNAEHLRIPTYYAKDQQAQTAIAKPDDALSTGLRRVWSQTTEKRVPIYSVAEANERFPDWEENSIEGYSQYHTRLVIHDPRNSSAPFIYPVGFDSTEKIRYLYTLKVSDMVELTDEIWDGHLEEFHRYVPMFTIWKMLLGKGDNRFQLFKAECDSLEERLFNYVQDEDFNDASK